MMMCVVRFPLTIRFINIITVYRFKVSVVKISQARSNVSQKFLDFWIYNNVTFHSVPGAFHFHFIIHFIPCLVRFIFISLIAWPFHFSFHSVPGAFHFHFIICLAILFLVSFCAWCISFLILFCAWCISFSF